jgi:hypothetical protein
MPLPITIMMSDLQLKLPSWRQTRLLCSSFILLLSLCNFYQRATQYAHTRRSLHPIRRRLLASDPPTQSQPSQPPLKKILYIMTSMAEYDNGRRNTVKGYDRFLHTLVPTAQENVRSMVKAGIAVDVYLIAHYTVSPERLQQLRDALPTSSGLEVWDDATPLGYAVEHSVDHIQPITRALARQHRYVLKDKIGNEQQQYDLFVNFEDDMLVRAEHVQHFVQVTNELYRLRQAAKVHKPLPKTVDEANRAFYGPMTEVQLSRMLPGFIRVEAALPGFHNKGPDIFEHIPRDFVWNNTTTSASIFGKSISNIQSGVDAAICCHVSPDTQVASGDHLPDTPPDEESLYYWETSIDVLGVRQMPAPSSLGWVLLQAGNREDIFTESEYVIGDYWSGRDGYFGDQERPVRSKGRNMNNQGGWMATRRQIVEWHANRCVGGFLPPYPVRGKSADGLGSESVEFWSGGLQIAGMMACNLQRIITLEPGGFSRQLLYHTSNNKQRQQNVRHRFSSRSINQFWGQLNTIRKNAEKAMKEELENVTIGYSL